MNISNDKKSFYQWETNRFLVDEDFKINQEVCFSSVKLRKALVVKTKLKNNKIVVEVPNLLLQDYHPIMVHWVIADENGKYVTKEQEFQVLKRAKPEDYVYTETEIFSFLDLEQRLKNLEEEGINKAIADYFVKNPIQSGATSEQAAQIIQNKENIEKLNKNKLDADKLPEAINNALAQAEASGAFKGEPGKDGVVPVTGAAVGQTVKITAVDENGNPTEWEATDFPESSTQADWNQNNPEDGGYIANRTHYDYVAHILKTKEEISAIINSHGMPRYGEVLEDLTFRVVVDGTVYDNVPVCYTHYTGSDTWGIGDIYNSSSPNPWDTTNYGFCYSLYGPIHNSDVFPNGIQSIEIYTAEKKSKQLDPKYIKDMYYETPEVWTTLDIVDNGNKLITNYYWEINKPYKLRVDGVVYSFDSITKGAYHSASGFYTWYFGSEPLIANTIIVNNWNYPFTIYSTGYGSPRRKTYVLFEDGAVDHTVEVFESETIVHTIAPKYIKDMYYEIPSVWIKAELIDDNWSGRATCKLASTPIEWTVDNSYRIRIDGVEYVFDGMSTRKATAATGMQDVYYIGATYIPLNSNMDFLEYKFCLLTTDFTNIYVVFEDATTNHIIEFFESESVIHHLDPKYIKDMYHEEPAELFSVENAEFVDNAYMLETPFAIEDGNTYIVNWDGVEYTCEAYTFQGIPAIGNTAEFGGKGNGEPFVIGYNSYENVTFVNSFEDLATHTFSVTEIVRHTIAPKYIKDMYYEEENLVNIAGLEYFLIDPISDGVTEYTYDYIPLELGQTWDIYYNPNSGSFTVGDYSSMQVQEDEDGNLYIGDPEVNTYPFYITNNFIRINAKWYNATKFTVVKIVGVSGTYTDDPIVRQIDPKYLPILEEAQETIFESGDFVVLREYIGPEYGKLLGKYIVSIDGISETVEFIESDEYSSFVETDYYMIHSSNDPDSAEYNKIFMGLRVPDDIVHSVKLTRIKDVIKAEYLPDSDWNQNDENAPGYIKNRPFYEEENILLEYKTNEPVIMVQLDKPDGFDKNKSYIFEVNGVEYKDVPSGTGSNNALGGYAWCGSHLNLNGTVWDETSYPFCFTRGLGNESIYISINDTVDFPATFRLKEENTIHHLDPKYIKDMYYDKDVLIPVHDSITLECNKPTTLGDISCYYGRAYAFWLGDHSEIYEKTIKVVFDGEPYDVYVNRDHSIGSLEDYPFYIDLTSDFVVFYVYDSGKHTFEFYIESKELKQIDTKYLPILEETQETVIETEVTDLIELIGPEYEKLLGKYNVVIDGVSETVEFIDHGIESFVETESFFIYSSTDPEGNVENNGFTMGFVNQDGNSHSVEILAIKDVIKEEYLPDSVTAKPDWNQSDEASSDYVKNRTHYDDITHYLIDGAFVNLDINQLYTVQIYDDIYENVPVYNAGSNNDPRWGVGDKRVVNYPFGFFKYPCWPSNDIINTELSMISFDRNIYPDATINDVQIYQRILKKLDEKYIPDSVKGMLVTVSEDAEGNLVASNNSEEIIAAYEAGVCVRLEYNGLVHDLTLIMENMPIFLCMVPNSQTNIGVYMIVVNADYTINVQEESYNIPTIDATLAIEGAAADAKATGDAISAVSALVGDVAVSEQISSALAESAIPTPTTAQVGQLLSVKAIDENGKPTEWEAVDMPTDAHINSLIDAKLGVIENGSY